MIIVEMNPGPKIPYEESGTRLTLDDDLTINLAKRQRDDPEHIDVCYDADRELVIGAAAGRAYVAQIDIPAREYDAAEPSAPLPLDMDKVTLTLWAIG